MNDITPPVKREPRLSVAVVIGRQRERAQECLDALCSQTALDAIEILLADANPAADAPRWPQDAPVTYLPLSTARSWGNVRADLVRLARAPVVAFLEEHCPPEHDWAEHVMEAHRGPWAAVAYAIKNGSPDTYLHRAAWMAEYGFWAQPAREGPIRLMPGNNIAYKRELLLQFGDALDELMTVDFNVIEMLQRQGHQMYQSARAVAAHATSGDFAGLLRANASYTRLLAANRANSQKWSPQKRYVYAAAMPLLLPPLRLIRLARSLWGRPAALWALYVASLPLAAAVYLSAAIGESIGYLRDQGDAGKEFVHWELQADRVKRGGGHGPAELARS